MDLPSVISAFVFVVGMNAFINAIRREKDINYALGEYDMAIIICDLDATLWDFLGVHEGAYRMANKELGVDSEFKSAPGTTTRFILWNAVKDRISKKEFDGKINAVENKMAQYYIEAITKFLEDNPDDFDVEGYYEDENNDHGTLGVYVGAKEFLRKAREKGHTLVVGTGNSKVLGEAMLQATGLFEYFHTGAYGDEGNDRKEIFEIALKRGREIEKEGDVFVIDDSVQAVDAGNAIGAKVISMMDSPHSDQIDQSRIFAGISSVAHYDEILELIGK